LFHSKQDYALLLIYLTNTVPLLNNQHYKHFALNYIKTVKKYKKHKGIYLTAKTDNNNHSWANLIFKSVKRKSYSVNTWTLVAYASN
jgi:hypothetical protein